MPRKKLALIAVSILCVLTAVFLQAGNILLTREQGTSQSCYQTLEPDTSDADPLEGLNEDFTANEAYATNLPIVVLHVDGEIPYYKRYIQDENDDTTEVILQDEKWVSGTLSLIAGGEQNRLTDTALNESAIRIKRRGHSSITYDKAQYSVKLVDEHGDANSLDLLGMGLSDSWILNGSMADKSMIRNYLGYRIASEIMPETPDSRFCEVFLEQDGNTEYQGVYLLLEPVSRGENRINIDESKQKNPYTSYIVRRDRFNHYDTMLKDWARINGLSEEWIGVRYPSEKKQTEENIAYIENDFSQIEQVLYASSPSVFENYDKYIDVDSFVDYFLINEFFGNYDSGEHSTYMWKNSGERLHIGPVWDFDQAMNNVLTEEQDTDALAMQDKPFFKQLCQDEDFVDKLFARYQVLRRSTLSEKHINAVIDETAAYLKSAQQREWYRWAADYMDFSGTNTHNYTLKSYVKDGVVIQRFTDRYEQELYTIRVYLSQHGKVIPVELRKLEKLTTTDTGVGSKNTLVLIFVLLLFITPSFLINKRG